MDFLLDSIISYIQLYKYTALFSVTFLAALILPIPSAATLIASAAFAGQGFMSLPLVVLTAALGNIAGDNLGYWLARRFGRLALSKIGYGRILRSPVFQAIELHIERRPALFVFFSRFEVLATISVNILAGLSKMPYASFLLFEVPGELVQVFLYASLGYFFGSSWENINDIIGKLSLVIVLGGALAVAVAGKRMVKWLVRTTEN